MPSCRVWLIHDALTEYAESLGVGPDFEALYQEILGYLSEVFGVSEEQARETIRILDDLEYTMALLDIVDPAWRDEIQPTVEYTEAGAAMPEYTGAPPAPAEEAAPPEEEPPVEEENHESADAGTEEGGSTDDGFTLTPDSNTDITNSDGSHVEVSEPETNTGGGDEYIPPSGGTASTDPGDLNTASDGTPLYSFNLKKGADGTYHQTN